MRTGVLLDERCVAAGNGGFAAQAGSPADGVGVVLRHAPVMGMLIGRSRLGYGLEVGL